MWLPVLYILLLNVANTINFNFSEKSIFPQLINTTSYWKNNDLCRMQNRLYREQLQNLTLWAYEMWDASVKYPVGILRGNIFQMGDWDECLTINGPFSTRYCLASLSIKVQKPEPSRDPLSIYFSPYESVFNRIYKTNDVSQLGRDVIHIGLCIPASCQPKDLEDTLNKYLSNKDHLNELNVTYEAKVSENLCQLKEDYNAWDLWDTAFCCLTFVIIVLVILSTMYNNVQSSVSNKLYTAFSIKNNFIELSKIDGSDPKLNILYGVKIFSIIMIIMGHKLGTFVATPIMNFDYIEKQYRSVGAILIFNMDLFVDTFFTLSGLLVTYNLLLQFDKRIINPFFLIFLRYIRLTPAYVFVIFYYSSVFNRIGSGPIWKLIIGPEVKDCRQNWWTNLLYISNYVNTKHMCMVHSWYLSCDFHFFIMGIFVVLLINKRKLIGLGVLLSLFVASVIIPFALTVVYSRPPLFQFYPDTLAAPKLHPDFQLTYIKSHTRAAPYIVGMFAGFIYYRFKDTPKQLSKVASYSLTIISVMILLSSIVPNAKFIDQYSKYNAIASGAYAALRRAAWAVGTISLLFSISYGHSTLLKSVLSWPVWIPLGKLVYGAYLIHVSFQFRSMAVMMSPKYFTYYETICSTLSDIVLAFICGLFIHLGIEAPLRKVFKELLRPIKNLETSNLGGKTSETSINDKVHNSQL